MSTKQNPILARSLPLFLAIALAFAALAVRAQDAPPPPDNGTYADQGNGPQGGPDNGPDNGQDPPSRAARMSVIDGTVSFQPGGQGDWGGATRNRPVTVGDKIWSDKDSRAELQAGQASIRLSSMTALSFLNLDDQTTQMRLAEGSLNFRVRELREGDVYEVDTPNVSFNVTQAGAFRIDVNENGDGTRVTVIRGEGQVTGGGEVYTIHAGERGEFSGTEHLTYFVASAPAPDDFDRWSNSRDLRDDNSVSARYVSRDTPGYSDLDESGTWNEEPNYGPVWYPEEVDPGWAPYSYGSWNYVGPWGWSWVGYEPWGFAPYHYGRWAYIGSRWGWCPGPYYARPIYGPAFVGFIGGAHFGVGFGFGGGIGWFPLGFGEPFHPWYHASDRYYRNVNFNNTRIRNTTIINNRSNNFNYAYAHNTNAVTVASRNNFANGQVVRPGNHRINGSELRGAQVTNRVNVAPTRQSYFGATGTHNNIARPSSAIQNRPVIARTAPAAAASNIPVRTLGNVSAGSRAPAMGRAAQMGAAANINRPSFSAANQGGQFSGGQSSRQRELSQDKPQSHMRYAGGESGGNVAARGQASSGYPSNNRHWSAQGNATDGGRAPSGFGASSSPRSDRPPSAYSSGNNNSGYAAPQRYGNPGNRPDNSNNSNRGYSQQPPRSYSPPQRSYSPPQRSYSPPQRSNSAPSYAPPRNYSAPRNSAPPRSYSAPSRSYPAPSHTSGGGGGGGSHASAPTPRSSGGSSHSSGSSREHH